MNDFKRICRNITIVCSNEPSNSSGANVLHKTKEPVSNIYSKKLIHRLKNLAQILIEKALCMCCENDPNSMYVKIEKRKKSKADNVF